MNKGLRTAKLRLQKIFVFMMVVWLGMFSNPVWAEEANLSNDVRMLTGLCLDAVNEGNSSAFGDWQFSETVGTNERRLSLDGRFRVFFGPTSFKEPPTVELHSCTVRFEKMTGGRLKAVRAVGDVVTGLIGTEVGGVRLHAGRNTHVTQTPRATACLNGYTVEVVASIGVAKDYAEAVMLKVGYSYIDPGAC
ncbi:MAG: hypothetical protein ABJF50_09120 [Paracoccaceae bacterium]